MQINSYPGINSKFQNFKKRTAQRTEADAESGEVCKKEIEYPGGDNN